MNEDLGKAVDHLVEQMIILNLDNTVLSGEGVESIRSYFGNKYRWHDHPRPKAAPLDVKVDTFYYMGKYIHLWPSKTTS